VGGVCTFCAYATCGVVRLMRRVASSTFEPNDFVMNADEPICVESIDGPVECLALVSCIHYQNGSNTFEPVIDEA
jgi:hypothetical protein